MSEIRQYIKSNFPGTANIDRRYHGSLLFEGRRSFIRDQVHTLGILNVWFESEADRNEDSIEDTRRKCGVHVRDAG